MEKGQRTPGRAGRREGETWSVNLLTSLGDRGPLGISDVDGAPTLTYADPPATMMGCTACASAGAGISMPCP